MVLFPFLPFSSLEQLRPWWALVLFVLVEEVVLKSLQAIFLVSRAVLLTAFPEGFPLKLVVFR